jgi:hypothetical protein
LAIAIWQLIRLNAVLFEQRLIVIALTADLIIDRKAFTQINKGCFESFNLNTVGRITFTP